MSEPTAPTIASALNRGRTRAARTIRAASRALTGAGTPGPVTPAVTRSLWRR
jgi:hypothetical protein